jgi:hypothetical protein
VWVDRESLTGLATPLKPRKEFLEVYLKGPWEAFASKSSYAALEMPDLGPAIASSSHPEWFSRHVS